MYEEFFVTGIRKERKEWQKGRKQGRKRGRKVKLRKEDDGRSEI